jgi:thiamine biosynthesis lipoprotein
MRFAERRSFAIGLCLLVASTSPTAETLSFVHQTRYCMGTMFDIVVYHASKPDAELAVGRAMDEIVRLDRVLSNFKADSDLSTLNREGRRGFVRVDPSLYEVIQESLAFSRRSGGKFDVTIAPLLRAWKEAHEEGRKPSGAEIARASRCVGYEKLEVEGPDRIRFRSDCVELDLGGIGKGYAVDRGVAVLEAAGIERALINAGGSSIAAIGAPPALAGWPVRLGASVSGRETLLLRDGSISTSQQNLVEHAFEPSQFGEILDPHRGAPIQGRGSVSVVAPSATASDALSTTLLLLSTEEGVRLLAGFPDVSALWISAGGTLTAAYRESQLHLTDSR